MKQVARTLQNQGILREGQNWKKKGVNRPDHDCKISGKNRVHGRNELCDGCRLGILEFLGSEVILLKAKGYHSALREFWIIFQIIECDLYIVKVYASGI